MGMQVIIIDNRQERARGLLNDRWTELENQPNLRIVDSIDGIDLLSYDVIAIHGSYRIMNKMDDLVLSLVKEKYVVEFSGGITRVNMPYGRLLKIPANRFYTPNLISFCSYLNQITDQGIELSMLVYGINHWRIPQLLELRELLWRFPEESQRDRWAENRIAYLMTSLSIKSAIDINNEISKELMSL